MEVKLKSSLILLLACVLGVVRLGQGKEHVALQVYSDIIDSGKLITEEETKTFHLNYTLMDPLPENASFQLAICVSAEDADIAVTLLPDSKTFNLHTHPLGQFNFSVKGLFVGRTHIHFSFAFFSQSFRHQAQQPCQIETNKSAIKYVKNPLNFTNIYPPDEDTVVSRSSHFKTVVIREQRPIDTAFNVIVILLVIIVNLGLGCKTELSVVKATLRRPVAPVTGFCSQFIIMPLISFGVVKAFQFEPALALGFFALGCSPGGSASNAYTLLLDGDLSLSITMTFISTVAALGMIPLWLFTLGRFLYSDTTIKVPFQNILYSLLGLVIPVGIGLIIKHKRPAMAKVMVKVSKVLMVIFVIFVCSVGVYANIYIFRLMTLQVLLTAALLPYLGFILGGLVAFLCRMPRQQVLTIAIETGIQNTGIAIVLLLLSLEHPESDISITAPITSAIFTPLPLWVAIAVLHIRRRCCQKHKPLSQNDKDHNQDEDHDMKNFMSIDKDEKNGKDGERSDDDDSSLYP